MFYNLARSVTKVVLWPFFAVSYTGQQNVPREGGYILAPNHLTATDPLFVAWGVQDIVRFMAKAELFANPLSLFFFEKMLLAFAVNRGKGDIAAVERAEDVLRSGQVFGIFPEGTRSKTGQLGRLHSGVFVIAASTDAVIVPVRIRVGKKRLFRRKIQVDFLPGKRPSEFGLEGGKPNRVALKQCSEWLKCQLEGDAKE